MGNDIVAYDIDECDRKENTGSTLAQFIKTKLSKSTKNPTSSNDDFIISHCKYNKSNDDLIDITSLDRRRLVFVSLIGLYRTWKQIPTISLYPCLLLMPLKSKWIYYPSKYKDEIQSHFISKITMFSDIDETKEFIELLKWKNSQGLVFWMLDDYKFIDDEIHPFWYNLNIKLCTLYDPVTNKKYKPLHLDKKWWNNKQNNFISKFGTTTDSILKELCCLTMKYKAIQEIIYESNKNTLHPVTVYEHNEKRNEYNLNLSHWMILTDYE